MKTKTIMWIVGIVVLVIAIIMLPRLLRGGSTTTKTGGTSTAADEGKKTILGRITSGAAPLADAIGLPESVTAGFNFLDQFTR